jgi:hypothetical protein
LAVAGLGICLMDCSLVGLLEFLILLYLVIVLQLVRLLQGAMLWNVLPPAAAVRIESSLRGFRNDCLAYLRRSPITGNVWIPFSSFSFLHFFSPFLFYSLLAMSSSSNKKSLDLCILDEI